MIDGIVQEQNLGRFNNDGGEGQKPGTNKPVHGCTSGIAERNHDRSDRHIAQQGQKHPDNAR